MNPEALAGLAIPALVAQLGAVPAPVVDAARGFYDVLTGRRDASDLLHDVLGLIGPLGTVASLAIGLSAVRGSLKDAAAAIKRASIAPFEQTRWVQQVVEIHDVDRQAVVCSGPRDPVTYEMPCALASKPAWRRSRVSVGVDGPLAGRALKGSTWQKVPLMFGVRAEVYVPRFTEWRPAAA